MEVVFLLKGLMLGFAIAAPVGPIGVLCIRRTLAEGRASGLISGLGAASADAVFGCLAVFGLTFISDFLINQQWPLRLIGGAFLCCLGIKTFFSKPTEQTLTLKESGLAAAYASTFFLTLANPMTILSFTAMFAGLGILSDGTSYVSAGSLVGGVFAGSSLWWLVLSSGANLFRARLNQGRLKWANKIAGVVITGFGILALVSLGW